ncbi:MAG: hypothetical protein AABZ64_07820 [Nitrospinota bacterium]
MTIEERFERIEKENQALKSQARNLRKLAWGAVAIALAAFVGGTALSVRAWTAAIDPVSITAQTIALKDSTNKVRLTLSGSGSVAYIQVLDANGKARAALTSNGIVMAMDSNGVGRVTLYGSDGKIIFRDAGNQVVATLP